jgi:hypothetical protein
MFEFHLPNHWSIAPVAELNIKMKFASLSVGIALRRGGKKGDYTNENFKN